MPTGMVKWFDERKGYGFIQGENERNDIFVHFSAIEGNGFKTLVQGEKVQYDLNQGPKGLQAVKVTRLPA